MVSEAHADGRYCRVHPGECKDSPRGEASPCFPERRGGTQGQAISGSGVANVGENEGGVGEVRGSD